MEDSMREHGIHDRTLTLNGLLSWLQLAPVANDIALAGVKTDSRRIKSGDVFLAIPGYASDGRSYIEKAVASGAVAILAEAGGELHDVAVPVFEIKDLHKRAGELISFSLDHPSRSVKVIGVTGTNGKSSTVHFLADLLDHLSNGCGLMGTLGQGRIGHLEDTGNTTADLFSSHSFAARMRDEKVGWMAMEVSSHGLDQGRINGLQLDTAVFTNLTRDHLDYHGTMEAYAQAKARLFAQPGLRFGIFNMDDEWAGLLRQQTPDTVQCIGCSLKDSSADVYLHNIELLPNGMRAALVTPWGKGQLNTPLMGSFNLSNLLGVIAVLGCHGFPLDKVLAAIPTVASVPGRLERLGGESQPSVVIDYAHTPDALSSALRALREHGGSRVVCVFGCGGNRDRGKRALMAEAACADADRIYLTSDNPRNEQPEAIIDDCLAGLAEQDRNKVTVVVDRAEAISQAVAAADIGEVVLVAGKGHENYQEVQGVRYPFSDFEQVSQALGGRVS